MTLDVDEFIRRFLIDVLPGRSAHPPYAAENKEKSSLFRPGQVLDQFGDPQDHFPSSAFRYMVNVRLPNMGSRGRLAALRKEGGYAQDRNQLNRSPCRFRCGC
jgi:hypothetical protein